MIVEVDFEKLYNYVADLCDEVGQYGCSGTLIGISQEQFQKELEEKCK